MKSKRPDAWWRLVVVGTIAFAAILPAPGGARSVVVRSTGPSAAQLRPGQILPEPLVLRLLAGDQVTVLDEQGTRNLRGPATIDETTRPTTRPAARLSWQTVLGARLRPRAAGTRGLDDSPPLKPTVTSQRDLWLIDPFVPGHWCTADPATLGFWRRGTTGPQALTVSMQGNAASVAWLDGRQSTAWPASLVPQSGARYSLSVGAGPPRTVTLHLLADFASLDGLATQLADNKCYHQLGILVGT